MDCICPIRLLEMKADMLKTQTHTACKSQNSDIIRYQQTALAVSSAHSKLQLLFNLMIAVM